MADLTVAEALSLIKTDYLLGRARLGRAMPVATSVRTLTDHYVVSVGRNNQSLHIDALPMPYVNDDADLEDERLSAASSDAAPFRAPWADVELHSDSTIVTPLRNDTFLLRLSNSDTHHPRCELALLTVHQPTAPRLSTLYTDLRIIERFDGCMHRMTPTSATEELTCIITAVDAAQRQVRIVAVCAATLTVTTKATWTTAASYALHVAAVRHTDEFYVSYDVARRFGVGKACQLLTKSGEELFEFGAEALPVATMVTSSPEDLVAVVFVEPAGLGSLLLHYSPAKNTAHFMELPPLTQGLRVVPSPWARRYVCTSECVRACVSVCVCSLHSYALRSDALFLNATGTGFAACDPYDGRTVHQVVTQPQAVVLCGRYLLGADGGTLRACDWVEGSVHTSSIAATEVLVSPTGRTVACKRSALTWTVHSVDA